MYERPSDDLRNAFIPSPKPGMAKLGRRNHVVQNLRANFILYVLTIKCNMCVQEKIEIFSMAQGPKLSTAKFSGDLSLATKGK